jgi:hypothetical protein
MALIYVVLRGTFNGQRGLHHCWIEEGSARQSLCLRHLGQINFSVA